MALLPMSLLACTSLLGDFDVTGNGSGDDVGQDGGGTDGTLGDGSPSDGSAGGDGALADGGVKCGFPGEACCTGPFAPCNDGLKCVANECKLSDVRAVGVGLANLFTTHGVSLVYDGNTWTKGPDITLATSSAATSNPYPTGLWSSGVNAYTLVTTAGFVMPYVSASSPPWRTCSSTDAPCPHPSGVVGLWNILGFSASDYWLAGANVFYKCDGATCTNTVNGLTGSWSTGSFAGTSSNDLWYGLSDRVFHYNGTAWTITTGISARGMWAKKPNDVWAVGDNASLKHFDGTTWSPSYTVALPDGGTYHASLYAASGTASNDVWVAGYDNPAGNIPFTAHWNGTSWTSYLIPAASAQLDSLWAGAHDEVFATGSDASMFKWNGTAWQAQTLPIDDNDAGVSGPPSGLIVTGSAKPRP
ncbi:MAG: hypothetical protein ABI551_03155 [Polyangiaceae bacterium]